MHNHSLPSFPPDHTRFILCATDAGGIRNIAPLIPVCYRRGIRIVLITYRNRIALFGDLIANVTKTIFVDGFVEDQLRDLIKDIRPDAVISGTTRFFSPDRILILLARAVGIRTVVVFDEWFNYGYRFRCPDTKKLVYLPDAIALQDKKAEEEAVAEGIPKEICHITGSPALAELTEKANEMLCFPPDVPDVLKAIDGRPIITFISETHASDYGTNIESPGPLGPFIGYTEETVLESIINVLERLRTPVVLVEKLHPSADIQPPPRSIPGNVDVRSVQATDLWLLLWYSDIVIGMRSMALLEANILGCNAVSFQPGLIGPDWCSAVRLDLLPKLAREDEMISWLTFQLDSNKKKKERIILRHPFAPEDAADSVVELALNKKEF
ncbi:hypothetical protein ACFL0M_02345 [Thermodesulfobacteriota bacterium]